MRVIHFIIYFFKKCSSCIQDENCGFCYDANALETGQRFCMPTGKNASQCSNNVLATDYCPTDYAWLIVLGLVSYLFFFAPGMGPMPWTINAEIYPLWARSLGNSLATSTNWALNLLVSMTFLTLTETITTQVKKHPIPMSLIIHHRLAANVFFLNTSALVLFRVHFIYTLA